MSDNPLIQAPPTFNLLVKNAWCNISICNNNFLKSCQKYHLDLITLNLKIQLISFSSRVAKNLSCICFLRHFVVNTFSLLSLWSIPSGPLYHEECSCPINDRSEWKSTMSCPLTYPQILKDLHPFPIVDTDQVVNTAVHKFRFAGSHSICHYVVKDNQVSWQYIDYVTNFFQVNISDVYYRSELFRF